MGFRQVSLGIDIFPSTLGYDRKKTSKFLGFSRTVHKHAELSVSMNGCEFL